MQPHLWPERPSPAKRVGGARLWSGEKLDIVRCYIGGPLGGFLGATKSASRRYYLDLFAGPGRDIIKETGRTVDGSPLIAARAGPPFFSGLSWVDSKRANVQSLEAYRDDFPDRHISIFRGDSNVLVDKILAGLPRRFPVFAFLDPRGAELHWATIRKLAGHKGPNKIELFILFAYNQGIARLLPLDPSKMVNEAALDRFMPSPDGWRRIHEARIARRLEAGHERAAMLNEYVTGLKLLGYQHVPPPRLISTPAGQPLYFLVFATDHEAGERIMVSCLERVPRVQTTFLPYEQLY